MATKIICAILSFQTAQIHLKECPVNLFGIEKTLSIKKSPLFCLNSMRLSAFYLICTLFFIWRHTGFSAFFFVHKHFLVDLFREKSCFFYSSHYCVFIAPNKPLKSILFYNFSQWKKNCSRLHLVRSFFFLLS